MDIARDKNVLGYVEHSLLQPGESILWKGRPDPMASASVGLIHAAFGILFLGFAIFWTHGASQGSALFGLFGIPIVLVGLWIVSAPLRRYLRAARTYYAITDRRVLIVSAGRSYTVAEVFPRDINNYERTEKPDGSGNIRLRETEKSGRNNNTYTTVEFADGLWGVADVRAAADAITALRTLHAAAPVSS